jgi:hypothetical protein
MWINVERTGVIPPEGINHTYDMGRFGEKKKEGKEGKGRNKNRK